MWESPYFQARLREMSALESEGEAGVWGRGAGAHRRVQQRGG